MLLLAPLEALPLPLLLLLLLLPCGEVDGRRIVKGVVGCGKLESGSGWKTTGAGAKRERVESRLVAGRRRAASEVVYMRVEVGVREAVIDDREKERQGRAAYDGA